MSGQQRLGLGQEGRIGWVSGWYGLEAGMGMGYKGHTRTVFR
jgi:hypothetical protein